MIRTNEGALTHEHPEDHALEFFSKAGSLFIKGGNFYPGMATALDLFKPLWYADKHTAMKLLFWLRDPRGGAGNRSGFRSIIHWLSLESHNAQWISANLHSIVEYGRWDDLRELFNTMVEKEAASLWAGAIAENNVLAAKWADRKDKPLRYSLSLDNERTFRKMLAEIRKNHIVEDKMCKKQWNKIEYDHVPSVAMNRYTSAFNRNDVNRFAQYKEDLKSGAKTVHASVLFPHDIVRLARRDAVIAEHQFFALPNYMEGTNEKIVVICDTSASMSSIVSGSIRAVDVSQGLALYCSGKIPNNNPFFRKWIAFCDESNFKDWRGHTVANAVNNRRLFNGAIGRTRIDLALNKILETAKFFNLTNDQLPTMLLVVSDMQFSQGVDGNDTQVNLMLAKFDQEGYNRPKIVYWNTAGYAGSPARSLDKDVVMVSGFSPSILKAVLNGDDFSPLGIMNRAIEKYNVTNPV